MKVADLVRRVDELLEHGQSVMKTGYSTGGQYNIDYVKEPAMAGFRSASLSFIERVYGDGHPHFEQFTKQTGDHYKSTAEKGIEILRAIRTEIAGGWLTSVKALVAAELFSDFLDMAEHLLETGYKDPAAVMVGSVLEEHLRQLCLRAEIPTEDEKDGRMVPRKADRLNAELAKAEVYSVLDQKQITAWLELRNNAAHGKSELYNDEQVAQLRRGVTEFMTRISLG
jgi:hypothetical protein